MKEKYKILIYPLVIVFLTPIATAFGSYLLNGSWLLYFTLVPDYLYIICVVLIIGWSIYLIRKGKESWSDGLLVLNSNPFGYSKVGTSINFGMEWDISVPKSGTVRPFEGTKTWYDYPIKDFIIVDPPKCMDCKVEIEISPNFWGTYVYNCFACNKKIKDKKPEYFLAKRVIRLLRSQIESGKLI